MTTIPQVAAAMQRVLTAEADAAGRRSGFTRRRRKLSGASFVQALVFRWWANPDAGAEERAQAAAPRGVAISAYGLDKRRTEAAADCLRQVLAAAVETVVAAEPVLIPVLRRFAAVALYDGSVLPLPDALRAAWPGCGGDAPSGAALKVGARLDLLTGALHGPVLGAGRDHDRTLALGHAALPPGGLRGADLGFFDLQVLGEVGARGGYWPSRLRAGTALFAPDGARLDLLATLRGRDELDRPVLLGAGARLPARLLAARVPETVAEARRRALRAAAISAEQVETTVREHEVLALTARDSVLLVEALSHPPPPTEHLWEALRLHAASVESRLDSASPAWRAGRAPRAIHS